MMSRKESKKKTPSPLKAKIVQMEDAREAYELKILAAMEEYIVTNTNVPRSLSLKDVAAKYGVSYFVLRNRIASLRNESNQ
jgi:hypothetical protein